LTEIDIALSVLDHLAVEGGPGEEARIVAILVGPGWWPQRAGWIGRVAAWVGGGKRVRVPWEEVAGVESHVKLRRTAAELGLGRGDDRLRPWIERIPGANR